VPIGDGNRLQPKLGVKPLAPAEEAVGQAAPEAGDLGDQRLIDVGWLG
jgi:hypothetical protein